MPLIAYGPTNSFLFGIYGMSLRYLGKNESDENKKELSLKNIFIAGSIGISY
jgi:hypothetical protein